MKALCIAYTKVDDWDGFGRYRSQVSSTLAPFGAKFLVRGGAFRPLRATCRSISSSCWSFPHATRRRLGINRTRIKQCFRFGWRQLDLSSSSSTLWTPRSPISSTFFGSAAPDPPIGAQRSRYRAASRSAARSEVGCGGRHRPPEAARARPSVTRTADLRVACGGLLPLVDD